MGRAIKVVAVAGLALLLVAVWNGDALAAWMREARPLPYFAVMSLLTAAGAPITPFFVIAGATFGVGMGLVGSGLALAGSLAVSYWLARGRLRPWLVSVLRRFGRELPDFGETGKNALRFTLTVKFAPGVPAFLKNYILATAGVPFALYFGVSLLITGAYGAALIVLGESLLEHDLGRAVPSAVGVGVAALGLWWWLKRRARGAGLGAPERITRSASRARRGPTRRRLPLRG
jgi:uncharacterized membrane protein YdjX (TVP38/TMEM64 family)